MADITDIKQASKTLEILRPDNGAKFGLVLTLLPADDSRVKRLQRRIADANLKIRAKGKAPTSEQLEENRLDLLSEAISGWEWGAGEDGEQATFRGETPDCTPRTKRELLTVAPWIAGQVDEAYADEAGFYET